MFKGLLCFRTLTALTFFGVVAVPASAHMIWTAGTCVTSPAVFPDLPYTVCSATGSLSLGQKIISNAISGDLPTLTLYDFGPIIDPVIGSDPTEHFATGWTFSQNVLTPPPPGLSPVDDPTILNLELTCTACNPLEGPALLGTISVRVDGIAGFGRPISYIGQAFEGDVLTANLGTTLAPAAVPEPASLILFGVGFGVVACCRWKSRVAACGAKALSCG